MRRLLLAGVFAGALGSPLATAAVITATDFTANATGLSVTSSPPDTLSTATLVSVADWTAAEVVIPLGGLAPGDAVSLTNPLHVLVGSTIAISWDGGTFSDTLTTDAISRSGDTLDMIARGSLVGPGVSPHNTSELDLAFTQAGGTGFAISGSGSYTASTVVPEASTWTMLGLGFALLGGLGWRKRRAPFALG